MAILITQSLLSSWNYMMDCREESQDSAYEEFINALNRIKKEATLEMQNGIDFENAVYAEASGVPREPHPKWESGIQAVAKVIRGGQFQVREQRLMNVCGHEFLVYGILDALKAGEIYDVKFSNKGFGSAELAGKYLESAQHPAYFYLVPEAYKFTYLVSDGQDLYPEVYTRSMSRPFEEIVEEFVKFLKASGLFGIYEEKWIAK
ncbi:MAG: hypothetical protein IKN17_06145 [Ruminococcus sp.]|nr:hypothetical protein [Ruminococcus sp.]